MVFGVSKSVSQGQFGMNAAEINGNPDLKLKIQNQEAVFKYNGKECGGRTSSNSDRRRGGRR